MLQSSYFEFLLNAQISSHVSSFDATSAKEREEVVVLSFPKRYYNLLKVYSELSIVLLLHAFAEMWSRANLASDDSRATFPDNYHAISWSFATSIVMTMF